MSSDATKKRRIATDSGGVKGDNTAAVTVGVEDISIEMKVQMTRMQNEMDSKTATMQSEIDSTKRENALLKAKCESLERSMKILIDEQTWEYSAPKIPTSYWDERGFDQDYITEMEHCLDAIKDVTCKLRSGKEFMRGNDRWITVGNDDSDATALLHDDILLPHWKELM